MTVTRRLCTALLCTTISLAAAPQARAQAAQDPGSAAPSAPAKKRAKKAKETGKPAEVTTDLPASAAKPSPAPAPGAASTATLPMEPPASVSKPGALSQAIKDLELADVPTFTDLDLDFLKSSAVCTAGLLKEDHTADASQGPSKGAGSDELRRLEARFLEIAKESPMLKGATQLGDKGVPASWSIEGVCGSGPRAGFTCDAVLAARLTREDNGYTLSARMVDCKARKLKARVDHVLETKGGDAEQLNAWVEGRACTELKANCQSSLTIDADRDDMRIQLNGKPIDRPLNNKPLTLNPHSDNYKLLAKVGTRQSQELSLPLTRRDGATVFVRQLKDGGLPLTVCWESKPPCRKPAASVSTGSWTKPVGYVLAGLGVLAAAAGGYEYLHGKSLADGAANNFNTNAANNKGHGYYTAGDIANINSANSAGSTSKILYAVGGGLVAAGAVFVFAF